MSERKKIVLVEHSEKEFFPDLNIIDAKIRKIRDKKKFMMKRIKICSVIYDFSDKMKDYSKKLKKTIALQEIYHFLIQHRQESISFSELLFEMICKNIFRPLQINLNSVHQRPPHESNQVDSSYKDPSWPHLEGVYQVFDKFISINSDNTLINSFLTDSFNYEFINMFKSEDPKERWHLWNILSNYYKNFSLQRKSIREIIRECLKTIIKKNLRFPGATEILFHYSTFIPNVLDYLGEENVIFFKTIIIPLYFIETSHLHHKALNFCSILYVKNDHSLAIPLVEGLLRNWPYGNPFKEVWFIAEINDIIRVCQLSELESFAMILMETIIKFFSRSEMQISDQAIELLENDRFIRILRGVKGARLPFILFDNPNYQNYHWSDEAIDIFNNLKNLLKKIDPFALDLVLQTPKYSGKVFDRKV